MTAVSYPAVFHREKPGFWVGFPDLPGCFAQANTIEETYEMAMEALSLYLDQTDDIFECQILSPSEMDYAVRGHQNDSAIKHNIDFSQVLQDALIEKLCPVSAGNKK